MRLVIILARQYPWQSAIALCAILLSSTVEGISLTALLPLISIAAYGEMGVSQNPAGETANYASDGLEQTIKEVLQTLNLTPTIEVLLILLVSGTLVKSLLGLFVSRQIGYTVAQVATNLRLALLRALLTTRWQYFLNQRIGGLANAMSGEAMRASGTYATGLKLVALAVELIVYCILALWVSWEATLISLGVGCFVLFALNGLVRMSKRAGKRQTKLMKSLVVRLTDSLRSVKPLKSMAREDLAGAVLESETTRLNKALQKEVLSSSALSACQGPMFSATIAIALYVALTQWGLSLASVLLMVLLLARVLKRLGNIQRTYQQLITYESAYWSLQKAIQDAEREREPSLGSVQPVLQQCLHLDQISFAYEQHEVFRDISLTVPVGSFTTIVGPSGAGKTTIVDLVTGLLQPQAGTVYIDDLPLQQADLRAWRRMLGYVPQETLLLHDSVLTNVTLGDPQLNADDAKWALRAAGAWEFVTAMPSGMYSIVGEQGAKLSGGQRQRIVIARALAHRPQLLILDEATSALDINSEAAICETLEKLRGELTIMAITHRPSLVDVSDRVYQIQDGSIELLADHTIAPQSLDALDNEPNTAPNTLLTMPRWHHKPVSSD